jgi:hypothetical protein
MRLRRWATVAAAAALVCSLLGAPPARATTTSAGGFNFAGTVNLPTFPCSPPPPFGTGPCAGNLRAQWSGHLAGVSGTSPFDVTWSAGGGAMSATFNYSELQCLGLELLLGMAQGTGTAVAAPGEVQGKWQVPGESFPRDVIGVTASFSFLWTRAGTTEVLSLAPFTLTLQVAGLADQTVVTGPQFGVASFGLVPDSGPFPDCGHPWRVNGGPIAGTVPLARLI